MMKSAFTPEEISHLVPALEELLEGPSFPFTPKVRDRLTNSSLQNLENYSPSTHFTRQEYTIMFCALMRLTEHLSITDPLYGPLFALQNKVGDLAT